MRRLQVEIVRHPSYFSSCPSFFLGSRLALSQASITTAVLLKRQVFGWSFRRLVASSSSPVFILICLFGCWKRLCLLMCGCSCVIFEMRSFGFRILGRGLRCRGCIFSSKVASFDLDLQSYMWHRLVSYRRLCFLQRRNVHFVGMYGLSSLC